MLFKSVRLWNEICKEGKEDFLTMLDMASDIIDKKILKIKKFEDLTDEDKTNLIEFKHNITNVIKEIIESYKEDEENIDPEKLNSLEEVVDYLKSFSDFPGFLQWYQYYTDLKRLINTFINIYKG